MGSFNRDDRGGRGGFRGRRSSFSSRGRSSFGRGGDRGGDRQMFKAICDNCGKECEVPFKPTSGKPVYCSDCFEKMGGGNSDSGRPERSGFKSQSQGSDQIKAQIRAINDKLDKILELLEPKVQKEVFVAPIVEATSTQSLVEVKEPKLPKVIKKAKEKTSEE